MDKLIVTPEEFAAEQASKGQALPQDMNHAEFHSNPQGLRRSWFDTYDEDMDGPVLSPRLAAAVREYESRDPHEITSEQSREELARQKELSDDMVKEYRQFAQPSDYQGENDVARIGKVIHSSTFINKLRKDCGLKCWYGAEVRGWIGLYVQTEPAIEPMFICGVQPGQMTEYERLHFDSHGVMLNSKSRGWRTVLLRLIIKGVLTEEKAHKVFGAATGPVCHRYNDLLANFRNRDRKGE